MVKGISMKFHKECNNFYERYKLKLLESMSSAKINIDEKVDTSICNSNNDNTQLNNGIGASYKYKSLEVKVLIQYELEVLKLLNEDDGKNLRTFLLD